METFLDSTEEIASFVTTTAVDRIVREVNITALDQGVVYPNETILNENAAQVNQCMYISPAFQSILICGTNLNPVPFCTGMVHIMN